jgi:hypothetical protein
MSRLTVDAVREGYQEANPMNTSNGRPSSEFGGRAVLDEATSVARAELETGAELTPFVVTKAWGDFEVERFSAGLAQARQRMDGLLNAGSSVGHCALAWLADAGEGHTEIVIELGRVGGQDSEVFVQRIRPKRGLFRRFKLIGTLSQASKSERPLAAA